jgi:hypothetical protein
MGDILLRAVVVFCSEQTYLGEDHPAAKLNDFIVAYNRDNPPAGTCTENLTSLLSITSGTTNGYVSIFLAPSGSKLGWSTDNKWLHLRDHFVAWAEKELTYANILRIEDYYDSYPRWYIERLQ